MSDRSKTRQQLLATMVLMGAQPSTTHIAPEIVVPSVYVQELPHGVDPIPKP